MHHHDRDVLEHPVARWLLYFAFWTSLGLFNVGQSYFIITSVRPGAAFDFVGAIVIGLADWYLWAVFALIIARLARRYPFEEDTWLHSLLVHVVFCTFFTLLTVAACVPLVQHFGNWMEQQSSFMNVFRNRLLRDAIFYFWIYFAVLGVCYAYDYYRKFRERELRAAQLETRLAQAQLRVLKMQLNPHFLFNTLNAISALIHKDVDLADRMIARLGELLRITLQNDATQEVPLWQELDFIRAYLEIEQARLGPRLQIAMDVDPAALDAQVPNLLLQPVVENAVRHGVAPRSDPGHVDIHARRDGHRLVIRVVDDGPGIRQGGQATGGQGIGLANTCARLQQLYGDQQRVELSDGEPSGLVVTITLPFREPVEPRGGPEKPMETSRRQRAANALT